MPYPTENNPQTSSPPFEPKTLFALSHFTPDQLICLILSYLITRTPQAIDLKAAQSDVTPGRARTEAQLDCRNQQADGTTRGATSVINQATSDGNQARHLRAIKSSPL